MATLKARFLESLFDFITNHADLAALDITPPVSPKKGPRSPSVKGSAKVETKDVGTSPRKSGSGSGSPKGPSKPSPKSSPKTTPKSAPESSPKDSPKGSKPDSNDRVRSGRILKKWPNDLQTTHSKGLFNKGAFCYRNSLLQCLLNQPAIYGYFNDLRHECALGAKACLVCATWELFQGYWRDLSVPAPPKGPKSDIEAFNDALYNNISKEDVLWSEVRNHGQADSFELLRFLVGYLKANERQMTVNDEPELVDRVTLEQLFDITLGSSWTCEDCGTVSKKDLSTEEAGHGIGLVINLQIPAEGLSLVEYLRQNVFSEMLDINCEAKACQDTKPKVLSGKRKGLPRIVPKSRQRVKYIRQSPEVLFVRLHRFAQGIDPRTGGLTFTRINNAVKYEEYLNLTEFTEDERLLMYRLDGVVAHTGTLNGGHYIAAVREHDGKTCCTINDDTRIERPRRGTVAVLENPTSGATRSNSYDPYVLVYSKL